MMVYAKKIPQAVWSHTKGVMGLNATYRDRKDDFGEVARGVKGIDTLIKTSIHSRFVTITNVVCTSINSTPCNDNLHSAIGTTSTVIALAKAPFTLKYLVQGVIVPGAKKALFSSADKVVRVYNGVKALVYTGYVGAIVGWPVHSGLKIVGNAGVKVITRISPKSAPALIRLSKTTAEVAAPIFKGFTLVYIALSCVKPIMHGLELYQSTKVKHAFVHLSGAEREKALEKVDDSIVNEIFGAKYDALKGKLTDENKGKIEQQIKLYQRMKVVLTVNATIEAVSNRFLVLAAPLTPVAWVLVMGTTIVRLGADMWWERKVYHIKGELGLEHESTPKWLTAARVVTLVSLPLLLIRSTAPFAVAGIVIGTGVEVGAAVYKTWKERKVESVKEKTD